MLNERQQFHATSDKVTMAKMVETVVDKTIVLQLPPERSILGLPWKMPGHYIGNKLLHIVNLEATSRVGPRDDVIFLTSIQHIKEEKGKEFRLRGHNGMFENVV